MFTRRLCTSFSALYDGIVPSKEIRDITIVEKTPLDYFYTKFQIDSRGKEVVAIVNDVAMLFNQQRLEKISPSTLQNFLDNLNSSTSQMLKGKYNDEQLMAFIKSRYIQAPSEIKAWSEYLNRVAEEMNVEPPTNPQPTDPQPTDPQPTE